MMDEKQLNRTDDRRERILKVMLEPDDSYREGAHVFVSFLRENDLELCYDSLKTYAEWLDRPRNGKRYSAATYKKRLPGAKNRIRYLFDRSPDSLDVAKRFQLEKALKEIKSKKINSHAVKRDKVLTTAEMQEHTQGCVEDPFPGSHKASLII